MKKYLMFVVFLLVLTFLAPQAYAPTIRIDFVDRNPAFVEYLDTETVADFIQQSKSTHSKR